MARVFLFYALTVLDMGTARENLKTLQSKLRLLIP